MLEEQERLADHPRLGCVVQADLRQQTFYEANGIIAIE
jgi:hypothetical protein